MTHAHFLLYMHWTLCTGMFSFEFVKNIQKCQIHCKDLGWHWPHPTICEGSETLTECKSESFTYLWTDWPGVTLTPIYNTHHHTHPTLRIAPSVRQYNSLLVLDLRDFDIEILLLLSIVKVSRDFFLSRLFCLEGGGHSGPIWALMGTYQINIDILCIFNLTFI